MLQETIRGSLFPLLPLRVKCQNHERVPISPISPILVVHVLTRWKDMEDQNRGNRDPLMVLALHPGKTLRGSLFPLLPLRVKCQNHERVPISLFWWPMSIHLSAFRWWSAKTMRGSLFPLFPLRVKCQNHERVPISTISPILVANVYSSCQDMDHQNRGNRDPLSVLPWWSAKTMSGSLFPLFPLRVKCQNHERVPISPISPILVANVYSSCQDMDHQNRGNRGNRDPLMVLALHP